jgi:hypothetical protein
MEQKFIITDDQYEIQDWLDKGWRIVSVTAQHVASSSSYRNEGKFAIVLEK